MSRAFAGTTRPRYGKRRSSRPSRTAGTGPRRRERCGDLGAPGAPLAERSRLPRAAGVPLMERLGQRALGGRLRERPFAQSRVLPRLDALDERLPARCSRGGYDAGIAVGGTRATQRRRTPTIEPRELVAIVRRGGAGSTEGAALLGVLCFSGLRVGGGLRVGEGRTLRWPSLRWNGAAESWEASVRRKGRRGLRFLIVGPGAHALTNWRLESILAQQEAVFGAQRTGEPLSERGFRKRVAAGLRDAGSPSTRHTSIASTTDVPDCQTGIAAAQVARSSIANRYC